MFAEAPTGFAAFWQDFVNYVYPSLQMIFWIVIMAVAIWATATFKRWVDHVTGTGSKTVAVPVTPEATDVSVEEFVE